MASPLTHRPDPPPSPQSTAKGTHDPRPPTPPAARASEREGFRRLMAAAVADAAGQQPPVAGMAAPGQQEQQQQDPPQNEAGLVEGTLSSPRLPRQLSIRSKLLYTAIQEVRGPRLGAVRQSLFAYVFGKGRGGGDGAAADTFGSSHATDGWDGFRTIRARPTERPPPGRGRGQWAGPSIALCERAAAIARRTGSTLNPTTHIHIHIHPHTGRLRDGGAAGGGQDPGARGELPGPAGAPLRRGPARAGNVV